VAEDPDRERSTCCGDPTGIPLRMVATKFVISKLVPIRGEAPPTFSDPVADDDDDKEAFGTGLGTLEPEGGLRRHSGEGLSRGVVADALGGEPKGNPSAEGRERICCCCCCWIMALLLFAPVAAL